MSTERYSPAPARGRYLAPDVEHAVRASVTIPGSKSLTNRELVIAAIADGPGRLIRPLHSDDSRRMVDALRLLGVGIEEEPSDGEFGPVWHREPRVHRGQRVRQMPVPCHREGGARDPQHQGEQ